VPVSACVVLISLPLFVPVCLSAYLTPSMHDEIMNVDERDAGWSSLVLTIVRLPLPARPSQSLMLAQPLVGHSLTAVDRKPKTGCRVLIPGMHVVKSSKPELTMPMP